MHVVVRHALHAMFENVRMNRAGDRIIFFGTNMLAWRSSVARACA
jgi:hypothetical protein